MQEVWMCTPVWVLGKKQNTTHKERNNTQGCLSHPYKFRHLPPNWDVMCGNCRKRGATCKYLAMVALSLPLPFLAWCFRVGRPAEQALWPEINTDKKAWRWPVDNPLQMTPPRFLCMERGGTQLPFLHMQEKPPMASLTARREWLSQIQLRSNRLPWSAARVGTVGTNSHFWTSIFRLYRHKQPQPAHVRCWWATKMAARLINLGS